MVDAGRLAAPFVNPTVPAALRPYVTAIYAYAMPDPRATHVGLPSTSAMLMLDLGTGMRLTEPGSPAERCLPSAAGGLHLQPVTIHQPGPSEGVMLDLTPAGARALLGCPASALSGRTHQLDDVIGPSATRLREQVATAPGWSGVALLLAWLMRRLPDSRPTTVGLGATARILAGAHDIPTLSRESGWSARYLSDQVRAETGVSPKSLMRLARFERTVAPVAAGHRLADVAAEHGYSDQAHLAREWRQLAGMSPSAWRRVEGHTATVDA